MKKFLTNAIGRVTQRKTTESMQRASTKVLNRSDLNTHFASLTPSDLAETTIIFIKIDNLEKILNQHGKKVADNIMKNFTAEISSEVSGNKIVSQWHQDSFIFACPESSLYQSTKVARRIKYKAQEKMWKKQIKITCSIGIAEVADEPLHTLVGRLKRSVGELGVNKMFVDKEKLKPIKPLVQAEATKVLNTAPQAMSEKATNEIIKPEVKPQAKKSKKKSTICTLTGALNSDGLTEFLNSLPPTTLHKMGVIFIGINNLSDLTKQHGQNTADDISQKVAHEIMKKSKLNDTLGAWSNEEFLLARPNTTIYHAKAIAEEIQYDIENRTWLKNINLEISANAFDTTSNELMSFTATSSQSTAESSANKSQPEDVQLVDSEVEHDLLAMTCSSTGALNQAGLTSFIEQTVPEVIEQMSVIYFELEANIANKNEEQEFIAQQFVNSINHTCSHGIITRADTNEYILLCPQTTIEQATELAAEVKSVISREAWAISASLLCRTEVYDSNLNGIDNGSKSVDDEIVADKLFTTDKIPNIFAA